MFGKLIYKNTFTMHLFGSLTTILFMDMFMKFQVSKFTRSVYSIKKVKHN